VTTNNDCYVNNIAFLQDALSRGFLAGERFAASGPKPLPPIFSGTISERGPVPIDAQFISAAAYTLPL